MLPEISFLTCVSRKNDKEIAWREEGKKNGVRAAKKESIGYYTLPLLRLMQSYFLSIVQTPSLFAAGWSGQERSCSSRKKHVYLAGYGLCLLCMRPCANEAMMENAIYASAGMNESFAGLAFTLLI